MYSRSGKVQISGFFDFFRNFDPLYLEEFFEFEKIDFFGQKIENVNRKLFPYVPEITKIT